MSVPDYQTLMLPALKALSSGEKTRQPKGNSPILAPLFCRLPSGSLCLKL